LKPVVFYDTIVGSEDSILFGSEYDYFFKKVSAECNPKTPAAWPVEWSATREDYEYDGNAPTDVHNFWMKTVTTIHAHFPKPSADDLAAGEMYLVSDPVWQEKYFDISTDKLTMRDGHAAYAQKHLLGNMQTYLSLHILLGISLQSNARRRHPCAPTYHRKLARDANQIQTPGKRFSSVPL
jgi:hypothetical protein